MDDPRRRYASELNDRSNAPASVSFDTTDRPIAPGDVLWDTFGRRMVMIIFVETSDCSGGLRLTVTDYVQPGMLRRRFFALQQVMQLRLDMPEAHSVL